MKTKAIMIAALSDNKAVIFITPEKE